MANSEVLIRKLGGFGRRASLRTREKIIHKERGTSISQQWSLCWVSEFGGNWDVRWIRTNQNPFTGEMNPSEEMAMVPFEDVASISFMDL